jgi:peptide/nickel transport system permease protein
MSATDASSGRLQAGTGIALVAIIALLALISLVWTPHGGVSAGTTPLAEPGAVHWLGTDATGRDVVAALMSATLMSLLLAWFATLVSLLIGVPLGALLAARFGGGTARQLVLVGILPAALCLGAIFGALRVQSTLSVFLSIGLPGAVAATVGGRAVMAPVLAADFVAAARLAGLGWLGAGQRHVVPLVLPRLIALGLELLAAAMLVEVTLSFAGLGVDGAGLSLGTMLRDGQQLAQVRPLLVVAPGAVAVVTALALLIAASGLRAGGPVEARHGAA